VSQPPSRLLPTFLLGTGSGIQRCHLRGHTARGGQQESLPHPRVLPAPTRLPRPPQAEQRGPSFQSPPACPGPPEPAAPVVAPAQDAQLVPPLGGGSGGPRVRAGGGRTPPALLSAAPQGLRAHPLPLPTPRCKSRFCFLPCREPRQPHLPPRGPGPPRETLQ